MSPARITFALLCLLVLSGTVFGQTFAPSPSRSSSQIDLQALAKKIDEQNAKIDLLSQQILKLQQQLAAGSKPGVMIGEPTPAPSTAAPTPETARTSASANGNTHIVSRGETLIAIAKAHGVSVTDLQKANHIDNPTKLQAGQTIVIPTSPVPSGSPD